jgi:hypothetical protein
MDENRAEGTARKVAGKAQESIGRLTGDAKNADTEVRILRSSSTRAIVGMAAS